jgi:NAD(P)-dependent dehydrogenase (short-subunit alcohol dehydrogenase family)
MSRSRVLNTGSTEGLGMMAAKLLANEGHVGHAARAKRGARRRRAELPPHRRSVEHDIRRVAGQANATGPFDAIIHNAGVGYREPRV